jgi:hypothetical protein
MDLAYHSLNKGTALSGTCKPPAWQVALNFVDGCCGFRTIWGSVSIDDCPPLANVFANHDLILKSVIMPWGCAIIDQCILLEANLFPEYVSEGHSK